MFKTALISVFAFAAIAATATATATASVARDQFELRTGTDLVALCGVEASDPLHTASVHYCHGFGVGMYRTIMAVQASDRGVEPIICDPQGESLSRNEYFNRFVRWADAHPEHGNESAIDYFTRFLRAEFPCTK